MNGHIRVELDPALPVQAGYLGAADGGPLLVLNPTHCQSSESAIRAIVAVVPGADPEWARAVVRAHLPQAREMSVSGLAPAPEEAGPAGGFAAATTSATPDATTGATTGAAANPAVAGDPETGTGRGRPAGGCDRERRRPGGARAGLLGSALFGSAAMLATAFVLQFGPESRRPALPDGLSALAAGFRLGCVPLGADAARCDLPDGSVTLVERTRPGADCWRLTSGQDVVLVRVFPQPSAARAWVTAAAGDGFRPGLRSVGRFALWGTPSRVLDLLSSRG